jgi:hypothetical protein
MLQRTKDVFSIIPQNCFLKKTFKTVVVGGEAFRNKRRHYNSGKLCLIEATTNKINHDFFPENITSGRLAKKPHYFSHRNPRSFARRRIIEKGIIFPPDLPTPYFVK